VNRQKVVGKVGKFNICFRPERLTSHAGVVLLHDFAQRLGGEGVLEEELSVKTRERGYREAHSPASTPQGGVLCHSTGLERT